MFPLTLSFPHGSVPQKRRQRPTQRDTQGRGPDSVVAERHSSKTVLFQENRGNADRRGHANQRGTKDGGMQGGHDAA
eukprot:scaffold41430_cov206-Amphora_coffeaeformis.AAC.1